MSGTCINDLHILTDQILMTVVRTGFYCLSPFSEEEKETRQVDCANLSETV